MSAEEPRSDRADQLVLAGALAEVGRAVRDAVLSVPASLADAAVVRKAGGDEVFGIDARADQVLVAELTRRCGERWPGTLVMEGFDDPLPVGDGAGEWVYLADPVDGTRPWLAGKRSAWVLLGAGRRATTLDELEVGAAVELPNERARLARVAWAAMGGPPEAVDDDLTGGPDRPVHLAPRAGSKLHRSFVTVARISPGTKGAIGRWEDELLAGLEVYEDPWLCSGGQLMGVASGSDAAVLDPRPLFGAALCAHPYDLAALVVAKAAGAVVEALPPGPLRAPLDPHADVAWAAYANEEIAEKLRPRRFPA
jgi:fructose-1,6-bisphosphatase/inositol monophosphatase family enzyme